MKSNRYTYLLLTACVCLSMKSFAQGICSSNALAPVFKQTFDSSKNAATKSSVPSGFVTNYTFQSKKALNDGEYIVTPLIENAQRADWAVGEDHTGNTNGNMFLVNAGTGASQFFYQQVDNLCPGSVYSFSAWLVNVNTISLTKPICGSGYVYPKVTFKIKTTSGTVLQTFTTDTLPLTKSTMSSPNWQQYGFQFTLPSGTTSLILEMVDYYGGLPQCGNDLAIDDIMFSACTPTATATLSGSSAICSGSSASISSSITNSPYSNPAYQWQKSTDGGTTWISIGTAGTGATSYSISNAATSDGGMYRVLVGPDVASLTSSTCVTASNAISLTVNPSPSISINAVSSDCSGNTLSFSTTVSGGTTPYTYNWTGPNSFSSTSSGPSIANITTAATGTYTLTLRDNNSCTAIATKSVTVDSTPAIVPISGNAGGCSGSTFILTDATTGGVWSSDNTSVATVSSSGLVTLVSGGTATISYTVANGSCSAAATKTITVAGVTLHPDVIECNNGISHFTATDIYYGVTYSNSTAGNTYVWSISGGSYSYQDSSSSSSQYPSMQLLTGSVFTVNIQFTTGGVTCSATQMIYKNTVAADTIQGSHDTTVCYNISALSLSGKASPVTNVFSWTSSGSGIFSAPSSLSTTYTPSAADKTAGVIKIYLSGSSTLNSTGNCGTATSIDSMILLIYPDNKGTNATEVICSNQSLFFTPNSAIAGSTFSWISAVTSGSATGNAGSGTGNIMDSLVNLSSTTDAVIRYTITPYAFTPTNNSCNGTPFTYTVTARPKPAITITNNTATICTGNNTNIQFNSSISGSTYTWASSVVAGTSSGNSSNAVASGTNSITDLLINNSTSNSIVRYRITATAPSGCTRKDSTDVLVNGSPVNANAGPDQSLCNVTSALLAANNPVLGTGSWTLLSGPSSVTFGSVSSPPSTVNGLVAGTYQLIWTVSNGSCAVSKDTVAIVNTPQTVAGSISANAIVCAGNNSDTLVLSGYTGTILHWESSTDGGNTWPTIINNTTQTYSYTNLTATTFFRAVVQNGACSYANTSPVTISVNPESVPGQLSSDNTVCAASNSGTLVLTGYTGSIVRWESSIDGGSSWPTTISNTTYIYSYTNLTATTLFRAIVQSGGCGAASSNAVTITVNPQTVPGTLAGSATVCATANSGTLSISGYTGNINRWEFSTDNGTTWSNIANTTNSITYNNLSATTQYRALVQSGICSALYSNIVTITVLQAVTIANAGTDQQLCNMGSATLAGNTPSSGTGKWTAAASNPTIVSFTNAVDSNTTVNGLSSGTYRFIWTISNSLCTDSKDTVQLTVYPPTVPGTLTADATVCASGNGGSISLSGYTGNIIQWEYSSDNGVSWNIINHTTASLSFTNLTHTTLYRVLVKSGFCNGVYSNTVTIHVNPVSAGGKLTPVQQTVCSGSNTGNLQVNGFTGSIMQWESSVDNGKTWTSIRHTDSVYTYTSITNTTWYRVLIESGVCSSAYSNIATISVNAPTVAGMVSGDTIVCNGMNTGLIILKGRTGDMLHWESSADNGNTWQIILRTTDTLTYSALTTGTQYRALVKNGACGIQYSNVVKVRVIDQVTLANAGTDQVICDANSTITLGANTPVSGAGRWSLASGPSAVYFTNAASPNSTVTGLKTGTYQFVWTISNGICSTSTDSMMIRVDKVLSAFNLSAINDCGKTTYRFYNTSESVFGIMDSKWYNSNGDTLNTKDISLSFTTEGAKDISLSVKSNTGCTQTTRALYNVIVYQFPKANIIAIADACKSQVLQVTSEVNSPDAIASLLWNLGNGTRRSDSIITVQYMKDGNYTIKLTVATINRCYDSVYKQIMIHSLPIVTINNNPTVCKGDTIELAASGAINYIWTDSKNNILCNGCSSTKVRPFNNQQYKVIGYNEYGCSQAKTTQVRVVQPFKLLSVKGDTLCAGQSRQLFASGASTYSWYPEAGLSNKNTASPVASPQVSTTYHVIGKDDFSCFADTADVNVAVGHSTPINIGKDTVISAGTVYRLNATNTTGQAQDIRKWHWNSSEELSCRDCASPTVRVINDATISCLAINLYGCTSTDTINLKTFCPSTEIFVPNAFSPDGDGINDKLIVQGKGIKMIRYFRIFNRWGEVIFEKTNFLPGDPAYAWDGTVRGRPASPDVFVYMCEVICEKGLPTVFKGNVAILR